MDHFQLTSTSIFPKWSAFAHQGLLWWMHWLSTLGALKWHARKWYVGMFASVAWNLAVVFCMVLCSFFVRREQKLRLAGREIELCVAFKSCCSWTEDGRVSQGRSHVETYWNPNNKQTTNDRFKLTGIFRILESSTDIGNFDYGMLCNMVWGGGWLQTCSVLDAAKDADVSNENSKTLDNSYWKSSL